MRSVLVALALLTTAATLGGQASAAGPSAYPTYGGTAEARQLARLHRANQGEVMMGRLAEQHGFSVAVRRYGAMLVRDHSQSDRQVIDTSRRVGINLAYVPNDETPREQRQHQRLMERLSGLWGVQFDREFIGHMVEGHRKVIAEVQADRSTLVDRHVARLVDETMPVLRKHLRRAQRLNNAINYGQRY